MTRDAADNQVIFQRSPHTATYTHNTLSLSTVDNSNGASYDR